MLSTVWEWAGRKTLDKYGSMIEGRLEKIMLERILLIFDNTPPTISELSIHPSSPVFSKSVSVLCMVLYYVKAVDNTGNKNKAGTARYIVGVPLWIYNYSSADSSACSYTSKKT
ncbi:MAG: hypothetical protein ACUVQ0_04780 [Thermoproteota archaeon]